MKYELARELKDAGFPQELNHWDTFALTKGKQEGVPQVVSAYETDSGCYGPYIQEGQLWLGWGDRPSDDDSNKDDYVNFSDEYYVKIPTLSELIEACGGKEKSEFHIYQEWKPLEWEATVNYPMHKRGRGATPEEAVARLWLALQKGKGTN